VIGHLGDTRAYLISAVRILQITEDHSWVAEQVRLGLLQPEEALTSPHRSRLLRVLGTQPVVEPAFYRGTLEPADTLLLCSDGLWESVGPLEVSATIQETASLEEGVRRLIDRALARSGDDNITVAAVRQGGQARPRSPALVQQARAPTPVPGSRIPPVEEP
jgi:protein phosphatase